MSVVLPLPLAPSRPSTVPGSIARSMPRSTSLLPKLFRKSVDAKNGFVHGCWSCNRDEMTSRICLWLRPSCRARCRAGSIVARNCCLRWSSDAVLRGRQDFHALAADAADDALGLEPRIGLADGHRVDGRIAGHLPDAGQQVALAEQPAGHHARGPDPRSGGRSGRRVGLISKMAGGSAMCISIVIH